MPTITFTATAPNGAEFTRTSGTMPYVAVLVVSRDGSDWGDYSWHKTAEAAHKAAATGYAAKAGYPHRRVVPAVPTSVQGKVHAGQFDDWPQGCAELVDAKLAGAKR